MKTSSRKHLAIAIAVLTCLAFPLLAAQNHAPVASNDSFSVNEDTVLTVAAPGVLANDTDADHDPLTAILVSQPSHGTLSLSATGGFTYTPAANFNGADSFAYKANDGRADSGVATVTLTVRPVNDLPRAVNDLFTINEDTSLSVAAPGVLVNDTDVDGDRLTLSLCTSLVGGIVTLAQDGSFLFKPIANFHGNAGFDYTITDGHGGSASAFVLITVEPVNDRPVVQNRTVDVAANGTSGLLQLPGTDVDGDALTFSFVSPPSHGTVSGTALAFRYTPNPGFVGTDTFTFLANDGHLNSNTGTFTLRVKPTVTINDSSLQEGCCSFSRLLEAFFQYTITLSPAVTFPVNVHLVSRDGTARAGSDYSPLDYTLTFPAGETSSDRLQIFGLFILGDLDVEPDETLFVDLQSDEAIVLHSGKYTILNDDFSIGVVEGMPPDVIARVGQRINYAVQWTHPTRWRLLNTIDVRLSDEQGEVLTVRFDQPNNTFSLFDPANEKFLHPDAPGSRTHFETSAAVMYLENSEVIGSGPTGPSVLLNLNLSFKPSAAGRTLQVEAFATDVFGTRQGFDPVGTITILRR